MPDKQPDNNADANPDLSELITLKQAAEMSRLSYSHLRLLARRGDIWAIRLGHNWFTTADAVHAYASQNHPPGPKPKPQDPDPPQDA